MRPYYLSFRNAYLERQEAIESNARTYPRGLPIALKSGGGVRVRDVEDREYIDCLSGAGTQPLGHNHEVVVDAVRDALSGAVPLQTLDLPTPLKDRFIGDLFDSLPAEFPNNFKIQFCGPSGADAIEAALKLVRTATGRRGILSFRGAYHGMTSGALSLTGESGPKAAINGGAAEVQFLPYPSDYRCPFGLGGHAGSEMSARYIENLLEDPLSGVPLPAAMILEVVQGEGGINPAPDSWLRKIREITEFRGIPLILDEVQTGLGRTGRLYAFQHAGITPDVLVLSKAIGGGLPLSVVIYRRELDHWQPGAHAGTFRGNQLAFAAGAATIRFISAQRLECNAEEMGCRLQDALRSIQSETRCIGHVRGRGLMVGVEIVRADHTDRLAGPPSSSPQMAQKLQNECLRRGLILERGGRLGSVIRFLPPLIVTPAEIDEIAGRFRAAVEAAEKTVGASA
ncbi:diaminobutyrate--2-oxoglutarate transaminase [Methylocystis bryophila]|uniref:Diaminobutyrate--2-oxoglutarate transaminase n=1 Tax=Methylocystis bryophila TaxID=655015 RepID=A0A1W6N220_9HYPH|nr:diaminobutyrate--2-oxoglutarate transaminase [Methylocystis bryophila]ARN83883.1 diaminobutyrate--2-oxoglutarate transaminase [Methylocystis bryophila]